MKKLLVIQIFRLGDILQTTPLLAGLKERYPEAEIHLLAVEQFQRAVASNPAIDQFIPFPYVELFQRANLAEYQAVPETLSFLSRWLKTLPHDYDLIVNLSYTEMAAALAHLIGAKQIIGADLTADSFLAFRGDWPAYCHTFINEPGPNPFHLADIYCLAAGVRPSSPGPRFYPRTEEIALAGRIIASQGGRPGQEEIVVLHAGASRPEKRWPLSSYARLGRLLAERGYRVVLTGTAEERPEVEELAAALGPEAIIAAGRTDLGTLAGILHFSRVLISADTGPTQVATALGRPAVTICLGSVQFRTTGPYGQGSVVLEADLDCVPCADPRTCLHRRCQEAVSPLDVLAAFDQALERPFSLPADSKSRFFKAVTNQEDGWLDWRALRSNPDDRLVSAYRRLWLRLLGPGVNLPPPLKPEPAPAQAEPFVQAEAIVSRAILTTKEALACLDRKAPPSQLAELDQRLERLCQRLADFGQAEPLVKPLVLYHAYRLASLEAKDPSVLLKSQAALHRQVRDGLRLLALELA